MGTKVDGLRVLLALMFVFHGGVEGRPLYSKKDILKTIKAEGGDIIDCVDIYKQPSLSHPSLKNHNMKIPKQNNSTVASITQEWQKSGSCPQGTIPILRTQGQEIAPRHSIRINSDRPFPNYMAVAQSFYGPYHGAKAKIYVWTPHVEPQEYSVSNVLVYDQGSPHAPGLKPYKVHNFIAAGWTVNPQLYGDGFARLGAFWSNDNGNNSGCWNLFCKGFIQTSGHIALGAKIWPTSIYGGDNYFITITINLEQAENRWYVWFGDEQLGYYPGDIFDNFNQADAIQWGGVVHSDRPTNLATPTQMGNGHFPSEGPYNSGMFENAAPIYINGSINPPYYFSGQIVTADSCYGFLVLKEEEYPNHQGKTFFYGGPGAGSHNCRGKSV